MNRILIVEDDPSLGRGLALSLTDGQTKATLVATCREAREQLAAHPFDLALFDVGLPDGSGLDLLQLVRQGSQMPVILVTANDMETDIVTGLTLGADDYITKPFSLAVLRARVANQLRRSRPAASLWQIGPYRFDFEAMEFSREGRPIVLSPTEQKLLRLLVENRGRTLPRERLLDRIWADAAFVEPNALSVTVKRLRDKLEDPGYIKTVYGVGYSWAVEP